MQTQFLTRPLWGVGSTGPYGHDGRSITLNDVILHHGGEAQASRDKYADLKSNQQIALQTFLNSLILFPPDDTASSLDPGDPTKAGFPQFGHGSIKLTSLTTRPTLSNSGVFALMPVYRGAQTSPLHSFSNSTARLDFRNHPATNVAALLTPARRWLHARVIPALSAHY
jgi:hypothetical protein